MSESIAVVSPSLVVCDSAVVFWAFVNVISVVSRPFVVSWLFVLVVWFLVVGAIKK